MKGWRSGRSAISVAACQPASTVKAKADRGLSSLLKAVGVPERRPFVPDPFQTQALDLLTEHDVLVCAPTGSGKTWIAEQAIYRYTDIGLRCWYTSPLKALSNSIYSQFCSLFGTETCGILTGDRKENPSAPVIIGTTEILRNQLYDAMHQGKDLGTDLVILDEAHYLSDPERGVVWEEVLIYLPTRVRVLLLSATVSNPQEVCGWLEEIRGKKVRAVISQVRPVPLEVLFLFPDGRASILAGRRGINPAVKRFMKDKGRLRASPRYSDIISCLRQLNLLPAIFFLKSRSDCDKALPLCPNTEDENAKYAVRQALEEFLIKYPYLKGHRQIHYLIEKGVGSHHAGQLPCWKALVEKMMADGLLRAIFSTSTVAAGVNFPARTVVLLQSDRFNGKEFAPLTATELHQMIGRAGRRGKDRIGFAVVVPGRHQDPQLVAELLSSISEPLESRININFSMVLNLLLSHTPLEVKDLLEKSFAAYLMRSKQRDEGPDVGSILKEIRRVLPLALCDTSDPMEMIELRAALTKELTERKRKNKKRPLLDTSLLQPGRIFRHNSGKLYAIHSLEIIKGKTVCRAFRLEEQRRRSRPIVRRIESRRIREIMDQTLDCRGGLKGMWESIRQIRVTALKPLKTVEPDRQDSSIYCLSCAHLKQCRGKNKELEDLLREFLRLSRDPGSALWLSFKKHLRFLKVSGFADKDNRLTQEGLWASKLRLDQPLLVAEAIRKGALEGLSPQLLASTLAPFVWDRALDVTIEHDKRLAPAFTAWQALMDCTQALRDLAAEKGFNTPELQFWPAAALYLWASQVEWASLMKAITVDEGDMAYLIMRTADHLRQTANLKESHPQLARTSEQALNLIMREPVYMD